MQWNELTYNQKAAARLWTELDKAGVIITGRYIPRDKRKEFTQALLRFQQAMPGAIGYPVIAEILGLSEQYISQLLAREKAKL